MANFEFLEKTFDPKIDGLVDDEAFAAYFKMRQEVRQSSETRSTISVLSLNKTSLDGGSFRTPNLPSNSSDVFKVPETPKLRKCKLDGPNSFDTLQLQAALSIADEALSRACSGNSAANRHDYFPSIPQTPKQYFDGLNSLTPDSATTANLDTSLSNSVNFPLRNEGDILEMLDKEKKKFIPNTSGFSHNSDITHFSSARYTEGDAEMEQDIHDFFAVRSNSISSIVNNKNKDASIGVPAKPSNESISNETMHAIQQLLEGDLSVTTISDQLMRPRRSALNSKLLADIQKAVGDAAVEEPLMMQSTPKALARRDLSLNTPVRATVSREPKRLPLDVCASTVNDNDYWQEFSPRIEKYQIHESAIVNSQEQDDLLPFQNNGASEIFSLSPSIVKFPTLAVHCYQDRVCSLTYTGNKDVVVLVSIKKSESGSTHPFVIPDQVMVNGASADDITWHESGFIVSLPGHARTIINFPVRFQPSADLDIGTGIVELTSSLQVQLRSGSLSVNGAILAQTPLSGRVGYGKFVFKSDSSPFVLVSPGVDVPVTREFQIKNVGSIPLLLRLRVATTPDSDLSVIDEHFTVPSNVSIPVGEIAYFNVTFTPCGKSVHKMLIISMEPNGKTYFDVDLVGQVTRIPDLVGLSSRTSVKSGSSTTSRQDASLPVKLTVSDFSLSWIATPLQMEMLQSFQIKAFAETPVSLRAVITNGSEVFNIINERGDALTKLKKTLTPNVPVTINVRFKPNSIGLHSSNVEFQLSSSSKPSKVALTGYGGSPKLLIERTILDLHGNKMVRLTTSNIDGFDFIGQFQISNNGNVPGFILISPDTNVMGIGPIHAYPMEYVLEPNTSVSIRITLSLSRSQAHDLLAGCDIRKVANLKIFMGDEASRQRFVRYRSSDTQQMPEFKKKILNIPIQKELIPKNLKESKTFQATFVNSLLRSDVAVVFDKDSYPGEQTLLDFDDSTQSFATLSDTVIQRTSDPQAASEQSLIQARGKSNTSFHSKDLNSQKVQEWLRKVNS